MVFKRTGYANFCSSAKFAYKIRENTCFSIKTGTNATFRAYFYAEHFQSSMGLRNKNPFHWNQYPIAAGILGI